MDKSFLHREGEITQMTKQEFENKLKKRLRGLPIRDVEDQMSFYSEMIDDRMEDGLSEEEAVADIGTVEKIATQIIKGIALTRTQNAEPEKNNSLKLWEILFIILGSPLWISLLIAAFAVIISIYAVLWSLIVSLWAVFVSLAASAACGFVFGTVLAIGGNALTGFAILGVAFICAGLALFMLLGCIAATKGALKLTVKIGVAIKNCIAKKEKYYE